MQNKAVSRESGAEYSGEYVAVVLQRRSAERYSSRWAVSSRAWEAAASPFRRPVIPAFLFFHLLYFTGRRKIAHVFFTLLGQS
jgi:hypothetical protein